MGMDGAADVLQPRAHLERQAEFAGQLRHAPAPTAATPRIRWLSERAVTRTNRPQRPGSAPGRWPGRETAR
jgi:hypothetical protein